MVSQGPPPGKEIPPRSEALAMKQIPLLVSCMTIALLAGAATAQKKSSDVVKATARAEKPDADGKQVVVVTIEIEKPYHLYANPVGQADLASNQTVLSFTTKVDDSKIEYPEGQVVKDKVVEIGRASCRER